MIKGLDNYDWKEAFLYADFTREDIEEIIAISEGENEVSDWLGVFKLKNGMFGYLQARCDYIGWDCQASGQSNQDDNLENLIKMKIGKEKRHRLALSIAEDLLKN